MTNENPWFTRKCLKWNETIHIHDNQMLVIVCHGQMQIHVLARYSPDKFGDSPQMTHVILGACARFLLFLHCTGFYTLLVSTYTVHVKVIVRSVERSVASRKGRRKHVGPFRYCEGYKDS